MPVARGTIDEFGVVGPRRRAGPMFAAACLGRCDSPPSGDDGRGFDQIAAQIITALAVALLGGPRPGPPGGVAVPGAQRRVFLRRSVGLSGWAVDRNARARSRDRPRCDTITDAYLSLHH